MKFFATINWNNKYNWGRILLKIMFPLHKLTPPPYEGVNRIDLEENMILKITVNYSFLFTKKLIKIQFNTYRFLNKRNIRTKPQMRRLLQLKFEYLTNTNTPDTVYATSFQISKLNTLQVMIFGTKVCPNITVILLYNMLNFENKL